MDINAYTIIDILSKVAIITAGIFAAIQLVHIRKQRSRESALQLINSVQTPEFIEAMNIIYGLPINLTKNEIEAYLGDKLPKVMVMHMQLESIGILVFKKEIKLDLVSEFMRGPILLFWNSMKSYFIEVRKINNDENYGEWVQWLAERIENKESRDTTKPAHIAYKNWKN